MKKSNFVAMILGTIGGILFALGMCMALIPEWNAFKPGIVMGVVGVVVLLAMVIIWRKMEGKAPVKLSGKTIVAWLIGIVGALALGVGHVPDHGVEQHGGGHHCGPGGHRDPAVPDPLHQGAEVITVPARLTAAQAKSA